ncbi:sensor histidine kinase [Ancylobacter radicis]|uniref:sensor histidine kinase n=1 Tax=Ancylobacter radicis TaxID=2836179 RepID=UPI00350E9150
MLFITTVLLYVSQAQQGALLTATVRSSGWVAYQARLELLKTEAAFARTSVIPTEDGLRTLSMRLEILRSRLPLLYNSDEGRLLRGVLDIQPQVQDYEIKVDRVLDEVETLDPEDGNTVRRLQELQTTLEPLGQLLHSTLMQSVAYNQELFRREKELAQTPGVVPLVLLFISGAALALLLFLQARGDRLRLDQLMEAQSALGAMEENLRAVIQSVPACMLVIDPADDTVTFFNSSAAAFISTSADDPGWQRLVRGARDAARAVNGNQWGYLSMAYTRPDGEVVSLRGSFCEVLWQQRPQLLLVLVDTTRVRNAELQVMQAAKLATLGEMATAIAHELNQPLAVIKMAVANAKRLLEPLTGGEPVAVKLDRISAQVDRAKRITDQVRRYGRMPTEQQQLFSLRNAVEMAMGFVTEQFRSADIRLSIQAEVPPELAVFGEQTMFEQVIVNLLVNAHDAFESGPANRARAVRVTVRSEDDRARVEVQDNAGGIAPEILARLFEPFATTKPTEKGTGLGLSLARSVVRDMGGSIVGENIENGARFVISLPTSIAFVSRDAA